MNVTLYKQMMKVNMKGFMNYAFGSAFYILLMFWLYPGLAKNTKAIDELVQSMPEGVGKAFGLNGFDSAEAFISGEYYGLILVLILSIVCVQLSTQLMAKLVDQGSMAYLLSTPTTRAKVAFTQASVLATGLFLIIAVTTIAGFAGNAWFLGGDFEFDTSTFIQMNAAAFLLFFAVGGISFLVSSLANDEKKALGISGLITFGFFSLDLLGKISANIDWMRSISIFSLYQPGEIVNGKDMAASSLLLFVIGFIAFGLAIVLFRKRDLPL
ncbi:ABC transporter permease subunit [Paenibacillus eucommiae]|uniref:ABC-2 type transport system permease protein n=1 Tax=Paenibacillus eucommiae TaxID=1355755 RepID=A0ABS4J3P8_9BACL|nr:ABC transporter permease subunit [Paenibacillus eucommiae]MBP1994467.1 ABC-2 type transport system permease protein [Paenibacillus eucommiae]